MKRKSKIITFAIAAALAYGSLFALVGPEKVRSWHQHRHHHYGHHHHHDCNPASGENWDADKEVENR